MTLRTLLRPNEPLDSGSDAASLHAALLEIDDWDFDFGFLFDTDPTPQPKPQQSDARPRVLSTGAASKSQSAAPYTGRNRRKLEIQSLREQSLELQKQLDRAARAAEEAARTRATPSGVESTQIAAAWEQVAATQRVQRASLEQENRQIRESIAAQAKIARQLFSTSRRARAPQGLLPAAPPATLDWKWDRLSVSNHLAQLDELHAAMSSVFGRPCFMSGRREFQEIQILGDPMNAPLIISDIAVILPFDMDQVADALWHNTVRMSSLEHVYHLKDINAQPSSLVSLFEGLASSVGFKMHGQIASRRYISHGSREIVSKIDSDVVSQTGATFPFSGEGWLRCTPIHGGVPRAGGDGATSPLTQVYWHRRVRVTLAATSTAGVQLTPDMMAARVRETLTWNLQTVENRLLVQRRRHAWGLSNSRSMEQVVEECL